MSDMKFKKGSKSRIDTTDFYYDLFYGGYIKPERPRIRLHINPDGWVRMKPLNDSAFHLIQFSSSEKWNHTYGLYIP